MPRFRNTETLISRQSRPRVGCPLVGNDASCSIGRPALSCVPRSEACAQTSKRADLFRDKMGRSVEKLGATILRQTLASRLDRLRPFLHGI